MNILFFSRLFCPHVGGVEKHVLQISKILIQNGNKVVVFTEKHDKSLKDKENIKGIEVYRIDASENTWFKKFRIWFWLFKHLSLINNSNIVHCHDVFFWYLPFRFLFPFKKVFTTFHGYESYPLKSRNILMHKISEKLSMGNICIGDFMKKWYGMKPTYTAYGGVEISNFLASLRSGQFPISNKIKKESAVFIGRLDEQTGIRTYVDAVKLIRKKIPAFKFEIIGDGKFRKEIEKDFKVLGFQKEPEKYLYKYNFAFVSRYLSIMEAMAAKRLVFAVYDNPLKGDYLRLAPFSKHIIIVNSVSELVAKVIFYLDSIKNKEKMIESAYSWVIEHSWVEMTNTYLKLWKIRK